MAHFITVPANENGVITDPYFEEEITEACGSDFGTSDVVLYSHGWWTSAESALATYNRFSTGFSLNTLRIARTEPPPLTKVPKQAFGIGLHWPSMISEDTDSLVDRVEALSYYTMEKRADIIGQHALYSIIRKAIETNQNRVSPLRFHFIGHSFGCKVVASALQQIANDLDSEKIQKALDINVVLLQAAFKNDELENNGDYNLLSDSCLDARLLITTSTEDKALGLQFPLAQAVNFFAPDKDRIAMGSGGPTQGTVDLFGGCDHLSIAPGFTHADFNPTRRMICADISLLHRRDLANGTYASDGFGGSHSDIDIPELYELIAGFLFK